MSHFGIPDPGRASKAVDIITAGGASPFDVIRCETLEGREYWSGRDVMEFFGYSQWRDFANAIIRARAACVKSGHDVTQHFASARKVTASGPAAEDAHLSRYACYLVAMNADPHKAKVAEAQTYFAVRTREAEVAAEAEAAQFAIPQTFAEALRLAADEHEARELAEAKVAELEPKAEFYEALMDADGCYSYGAAAKAIGWGRNTMLAELRRAGVLTRENLPYQRYAHHFKVVPQTYTRDGQTYATATTYVLPSGLEFLRKKLAGVMV